MSGTRWIALITTASPAQLGDLMTKADIPRGPYEKVYGLLGDDGHTGIWSRERPSFSKWRYLDDRVPNVTCSLDQENYYGTEDQLAQNYLDLLLGLYNREDVEAGTFEGFDEACFLYWTATKVVFNSYPEFWSSLTSQVIREGFEAAGIVCRGEDLGPYYDPTLIPKFDDD